MCQRRSKFVTLCMILFLLGDLTAITALSVTLPDEDPPQKGDSWPAVHDSGTDEKLQRPLVLGVSCAT